MRQNYDQEDTSAPEDKRVGSGPCGETPELAQSEPGPPSGLSERGGPVAGNTPDQLNVTPIGGVGRAGADRGRAANWRVSRAACRPDPTSRAQRREKRGAKVVTGVNKILWR